MKSSNTQDRSGAATTGCNHHQATPRAGGPIALVAAGLVAFAISTPVSAGEWYLGGSVGRTGIDERIEISGLSTRLDTTDVGFRLFGGYLFNGYLSVEAGYIDFGQIDFEVPLSAGPIVALGEAEGLTAGAQLRFPVGERFFLGVRAGALYWNAGTEVRVAGVRVEADGNRQTDAFFGAGVGVRMGDHWDLLVDYDRYRMEELDPSVFSIGFRYRF